MKSAPEILFLKSPTKETEALNRLKILHGTNTFQTLQNGLIKRSQQRRKREQMKTMIHRMTVELKKADNAGLIPVMLQRADRTKSITREEFG